MPTARQIDELEETLRTFHNKNHAGSGVALERCTNPRCLDARLSIAWLRTAISARESQHAEVYRKTA